MFWIGLDCQSVDAFIQSKLLLAPCKLCMSEAEERREADSAHEANFAIKGSFQQTGTIRCARKNIRTERRSFKVHESWLVSGGLNKNSSPPTPPGLNYCWCHRMSSSLFCCRHVSAAFSQSRLEFMQWCVTCWVLVILKSLWGYWCMCCFTKQSTIIQYLYIDLWKVAVAKIDGCSSGQKSLVRKLLASILLFFGNSRAFSKYKAGNILYLSNVTTPYEKTKTNIMLGIIKLLGIVVFTKCPSDSRK